MSRFNSERLPKSLFRIDTSRMREGWYSDDYFVTNRMILEQLAREGYHYTGKSPDGQFEGLDLTTYILGDAVVEMQVFPRRKPFTLVAGVDEALAILEECVGYTDEQGNFVSTFDDLDIEAVEDGTFAFYKGDPLQVQPVLKIRGRYRDFAMLETVYLGVLAEASRIATNVYLLLEAALEKRIFFFPARFAHWKMQGVHGYGYAIAVDAFKEAYGQKADKLVSTLGQGEWWGGSGSGTVSHALIAMFLGDTAEAMYQFCRIVPTERSRIALVDYHNDCVRETTRVILRLFEEYWRCYSTGDLENAARFRLDAVRPDTSGQLADRSVRPRSQDDFGVSSELIWNLRDLLDNFSTHPEAMKAFPPEALPVLHTWCENILITATGGFDAQKISWFHKLGVPVDSYGVGSSLLENSKLSGTNNDFTADIVRVCIDGVWHANSKIGRRACDNPALMRYTRK